MYNIYGSKVYIINRNKQNQFGEIIAMFDCRYMDKDFVDLFQNEIDFQIHEKLQRIDVIDENGNSCKYAYISEVKKWLKHKIKNEELTMGCCYRRLKPLYKLLKAFSNKNWEYGYNEILVLHYGY